MPSLCLHSPRHLLPVRIVLLNLTVLHLLGVWSEVRWRRRRQSSCSLSGIWRESAASRRQGED